MKPNNTNQATLDDMIFEHRNKAYGAYELRISYTKNLNRAFFIGVGVFFMLFLANYIFAKQSVKFEKTITVEVAPKTLPPDEIPVIEKPKPVEPPKEVEPIKEVNYTVIEVVETTENENPPPTQSEIDIAIIGTVDKEGNNSDVITETPPVEAPPAAAIVTEIVEDNTPFLTVEENPTFAGGTSEMYRFLAKNLKYPAMAQRANIQGKVFLKFIIEKDGSITAVDVMKGIGFGCDEEAARVVKLMPNWKAGRQNGRNVRVMFTIPVFFKLDD